MAGSTDDPVARVIALQDKVDSGAQAIGHHISNQPWSPDLVTSLAMGMLGFGAFALALSGYLLLRSQAPAGEILKVVGVISIVTISATLLVVGYSNEQLTPIVGLFGAIAGYLLGKDSKVSSRDE